MKKILLYLLLALTVTSCKKELEPKTPPVVLNADGGIRFYLDLKKNAGIIDTIKADSSRIDLAMAGDSVVGVVPGLSNQKSFVLSFEPSNAYVKIGNVVQKSGITVNDFSQPITYTFTNALGEVKTYRISISNFTDIPIFYLTTASPVVSEDDYVTGNLSINANAKFIQNPLSIDLNIKGRGNSTWLMPKKPYRLKFNNKQSLLGLKAAKNWVLLANYSDKTLLRNAVAFDVGHQISADFTPHYRFVELVMNGTYVGNYMLTEQVEVNPGRVDISDSDITGGYLLELDQRLDDGDSYFRISSGIPFSIKGPDDITAGQLDYIHSYVQQTEDALFSENFADPDNGYAKFINVDSFIDWYLVKELMKDNDGLDYTSIFYYKDVNGKLGMGPVWDFDLAAGNYAGTVANDPTGWWIRKGHWFGRLFEDPAFVARVKQRFNILKTTFPAVLSNLDANAAYINLSQQQNFKTWNILNSYIWPNPEIAGSYQGEIEYLKTWLTTRINWMDDNM